MWEDLRYGIRVLRKHPGFTFTAVVSLALAVGTNGAVFGVLNTVLLGALPYPEPERVMMVYETRPQQDGGTARSQVSYPNFDNWRQLNDAFESMAALSPRGLHLLSAEETETLLSELVSANYFSVLGIEPLHGRTFLAEEDDTPGTHSVCLLGYRLWQRRFGGDLGVLGSTIRLSALSFTVVGIMPPSFRGLHGDAELWIPMMMQPVVMGNDLLSVRGSRWLSVVARLKPGVSPAQAQLAMEGVTAWLALTYPKNTDWGALVVPLSEEAVNPVVRRAILGLTIAAGLVLVIVCINLAHLLLARAAARQREIAVRMAVGARPRRILRQLMAESLLLSLAGGLGGLAIAYWGVGFLVAIRPVNIARLHVAMDLPVVGFTLLLAGLTSLAFGLLPALAAARLDFNQQLRSNQTATLGRPSRRRGFRPVLMVLELALTLALITSATLMVRDVSRLSRIDLGFDPERLMTIGLELPSRQYPAATAAALWPRLLAEVGALPGVRSASVASAIPLSGGRSTTSFFPESDRVGDRPETAEYCVISPEHLATLGVRLLDGREFTSQDAAESPRAIIINETLARRLWPEGDALGKQIRRDGPEGLWTGEIVGVAPDLLYRLHEPPQPRMYWPATQHPRHSMTLLVRADVAPRSLLPALRRELLASNGDLQVFNIRTMSERLSDQSSDRRFVASLLTLFAALALTLALLGVYGITAFTVSHRKHELGMRLALGAQHSDILRMLLRETLVLVAVGLLLGGLLSLWAHRFLGSLMTDLSGVDWLALAVSAILLSLSTVLASLDPAWKSSRSDPAPTLRGL